VIPDFLNNTHLAGQTSGREKLARLAASHLINDLLYSKFLSAGRSINEFEKFQ
jgi:hypothetical protein